MIRLIGLVVSIGLADSLNPSTIAPALYLASGERARGRVFEFTLGVFTVYLLGGVIIALGPGQLILSLVSKPDATARHLLEVLAGAALIGASTLLWRHRTTLAAREAPDLPARGKSSAILGATITAVELPTAFPYFAALAAIVGSGLGAPRQLLLLLLFNVCFVLPLVAIVATLTLAPAKADRVLGRFRGFLERRWPVVLATLGVVAGLFVIVLGVTGFGVHRRGRFGTFSRHFRHVVKP